jgi:hypothetical protein
VGALIGERDEKGQIAALEPVARPGLAGAVGGPLTARAHAGRATWNSTTPNRARWRR